MDQLTRKIVSLSKVLRCPIINRKCKPFAYDGQTIALKDGSKIRTPSNLVHDIAHYLVATPERRMMPDFGLGEGLDSQPHSYFPSLMTYEKCQQEEELASMLGILIEKEIGSDWKWTWDFHSWNEGAECDDSLKCFQTSHARETIKKLIKRKLINKNLKPKCLSRRNLANSHFELW